MGVLKTGITFNASLAALGSAGLMLGALGFQYLGGLPPCAMCIWQRWPHGIAIVLGLLIYFMTNRLLALAGGITILIGAGIAFFHAGVEQKWWEGPSSCTGNGLSASDNLLDMSAPVTLVMCDDIVWDLFGITMATWNGLFSLILAFLWFRAYASSSASQ